MTRRTHRPRGLLLYEVVLGLTILSTFATGAAFLLRSSLRTVERADQAVERGERFDAATGQLRRDVWGASAVETPDGRTVRVTRAGEPSITWTLGDGGTLTRSVADDPAAPREWAGVADGVSFEVSGGVGVGILVLVEPPDFRGASGRRVPFASQVAIAGGGKP